MSINIDAKAQESLKVLQSKNGDTYEAALALANRMIVWGADADMNDAGLADWLAEGDYDGSETPQSLIEEWNSL